jgi:predicted ATP-grasp superfamily ATP-dependent carboligase
VSSLVWEEQPVLRHPVLVAAFTGWNDAGDAATDAIELLANQYGAEQVGYIDPEEHIDFQALRPTVVITDGVTREIRWPGTRILAARVPDSTRDLVLVLGPEPHLKWRDYCDAVLEVVSELGCELAVTLGSLLADSSHHQTVRITGSTTEPALMARLGMSRSRYEGPTGIVGVLHDVLRSSGVPSASLWAPVPHYVASPPNPPAQLALLEALAALAEIPIGLGELRVQTAAWRARIDAFVADDEELSQYVARLDTKVDDDDVDDEPELGAFVTEDGLLEEADLPSGDALAAELEAFLREQGLE